MSGAAVSAQSRPNDFRALIVSNPSPAITSWRRYQSGPLRGDPQTVSPQALPKLAAESAAVTPEQVVENPSPAVTSWHRDKGTLRGQPEAVSPQVLPTLAAETVRVKIEQFVEALRDACELSNAMIAEGEISPIDFQTLHYATQSLLPLVGSLKLPPPLILPLQNGGIGTEWHAFGMNIELRFRKPYEVYAVFEDARGVISPYHDRDRDLVQARSALSELSARAAK